jgi:PAS domain S-box-containing protein
MTPNQGSTEREVLAGFIAGVLILLGTLSMTWISAARYLDSTRQARRSVDALSDISNLRASFGEFMESQYGWLMTGERTFLDERQAATDSLETLSGRLLQRTPEETAEVRELIDAMRTVVAAMGDLAAPADAATFAAAHEQAEHVRSLLAIARQREQARFDRDVIAARAARFWVPITMVVAALSMLIVMSMLLWRIRRHIRERRSAQRDLEAANQLLESLIENIPAMVFAKDARDLRFVRFNRGGESLMGVRREDVLGKTDRDLFPHGMAENFISKDRETLAQHGVIDIPEEELVSLTHGRRILHTSKVPIRGEDGQPILLLGIAHDITERKAAERRIVALNEELIRQAQLLQSSNQELESFCYSVSHDLRAPLRAINGYARLLERNYGSRLDDEGARFLSTICSACERMAHLIDDLLEFSRLGRQTLQLEPVDMASMVSKVIDDTMEGREVTPPVIETLPLPPVNGDRGLLHLVWLNLIDNAIKYTTGMESPRIRIDAEIVGDEVIYSVTDNGIGFDMRYAEKLFGVFQRLHSDAKYPGTGVGLAIAHRIIARHGGRIWARSEPGRGTTFSFAIPANVPLAQAS